MAIGAALWEAMHPKQVAKEKAFKSEGTAKATGKEKPLGPTVQDKAIAQTRDEEVGK
jgi:hypothetical protein